MTNLQSYIVIYGDLSSSSDESKSIPINKIIADMYPAAIIGTGDYADSVTGDTVELLCNGIDAWSMRGKLYSSPGNHDNDIIGNRSSFNSFFGGGGYKKVVIGYIDFFIYDVYLKDDASGYYSPAQVEVRSINDFQSSTQGQWLLSQLALSTNRWKVVLFHQNCASSGSMTKAPGMLWDWYALGVDMVINAHQHIYERLLVNTGSGSIPIISSGVGGTSGQLVEDTPIREGSQKIITGNNTSANYDVQCTTGFINKLTPTFNNLTFDVWGIDASFVIHEGKDQLVINK